MIEDRVRWNKKYLEGRASSLHLTLVRFYHLAKGGKALDIACGTGENSVFLAKKGFEVVAFDVSDVAVRKARRLAKREGVRVLFKPVDVKSFSFGRGRFDLILNFYFLDRSIFKRIERALKPKGILIFETYNEEHLKVKPTFNPQYLLRKGELMNSFENLEPLYYCEVSNVTTLVARKP
ncbi:MAG: methyltransferase domain-containing protein [Aquificae bacterium]|nr:methyltransferase domain-containing protein [Aquificota bacterium]